MALDVSVLNAASNSETALFDQASLHTADPGTTGANEDFTAGRKSLSWPAAAGGISLAAATWTNIQGTWTHIVLWNSATFAGSLPKAFALATPENLTLVFQNRVRETGA